MEDNPAPSGSPLMDATTFKSNFGITWATETHLCYEVEVREGDAWFPVEELQGFLRNQVFCHAELCFLPGVSPWGLDEGKQYRLTWYMSWSPCPDCAPKLVDFLRKNSHVQLRVFAARIYTKLNGYEDGLRRLQDAGAKLAIMTPKELQHCWDTFVDNHGQQFEPEIELLEKIRARCQAGEHSLGRGSSSERGIKHFLQETKTHHVPHPQLVPKNPVKSNE